MPVAAPAKFKIAAIGRFVAQIRASVTNTVAIALAASLKPLARPKPRARMMRIIKTAREPSGTLDHYPLEHIGHILTLVDSALYMLVYLAPFDDLDDILAILK